MNSAALQIAKEEKLIRLELKKRKIARAKESMLGFAHAIRPTYSWKRFHKIIFSKLDEFTSGQIKKLMINLPNQHAKSEISSRLFPASLLGIKPNCKIALTSYGADHAQAFNRDVQRIIDSEIYRHIYPETRLSDKNVAKSSMGSYKRTNDIFEIVGHSGFLKTVGRGGALTGTPVDVGIIDDIYKDRAEAKSKAIRESAWEFYTDVFETRLSNHSQQLILNTRWDLDDLNARILDRDGTVEEGGEWVLICLPALCEDPDAPYEYREYDEPLWPEKHSWERLNKVRETSPITFASIKQQRPSPISGAILKDDLFVSTTEESGTYHFTISVQDGVRFGLTVFGIDEGMSVKYFEAFDNAEMLITALKAQIEIYHSVDSEIYIHQTSKTRNFTAVIQNSIEQDSRVVKTTAGEQEEMVRAVAAYLDDRSVELFSGHWNEDYKENCKVFPNGKSDVEAVGLAMSVMQKMLIDRSGTRFWWAFDEPFHVTDEAEFDSNQNVQTSFDQNLNPYMSQLCAHIKHIEKTREHVSYELIIFDEVCTTPPANRVIDNCREFKKRYPKNLVGGYLYFYGDRSLNIESTLAKHGTTGFSQIADEYKDYTTSGSDRSHKGVIPVALSAEFINRLMAGETVGGLKLDIQVHPRCKNFISDLNFAKQAIDGTMEKTKTPEGFEKYGHLSDALRYLVIKAFWKYWIKFSKR